MFNNYIYVYVVTHRKYKRFFFKELKHVFNSKHGTFSIEFFTQREQKHNYSDADYSRNYHYHYSFVHYSIYIYAYIMYYYMFVNPRKCANKRNFLFLFCQQPTPIVLC